MMEVKGMNRVTEGPKQRRSRSRDALGVLLDEKLKEATPYGAFARAQRDWRRGTALGSAHLDAVGAEDFSRFPLYLRQSARARSAFEKMMAFWKTPELDVHLLGQISDAARTRWPMGEK